MRGAEAGVQRNDSVVEAVLVEVAPGWGFVEGGGGEDVGSGEVADFVEGVVEAVEALRVGAYVGAYADVGGGGVFTGGDSAGVDCFPWNAFEHD